MTEIQMEYWRTGAVEDADAFFGGTSAGYLFIPYELARELGVLWVRWMTIHVNQMKRAFEYLGLPHRYLGREARCVIPAELKPSELAHLGITEVRDPLDGSIAPWLRTSDGAEILDLYDEVLLEITGGRELEGYCLPRTLMQSMPQRWQEEVVALARYAFSQPGASRYHPLKVVAQRRIHGEWREVDDPVPGHGFGRTRLTPHLESP